MANNEVTPKALSEPNGRPRWSLGMLRDKETDEVPGSVLIMSGVNRHNAPLGLDNELVHNSRPSSSTRLSRSSSRSRAMFRTPEKKRTKNGKIILEPQPEDSGNDPLNWSPLRRDIALLSLGFYCMVGGGMTPILAAGFDNVAATFNVSLQDVAYTTGLYMLGLGLGSVIASPTAILYGKRPVYLVASILFVVTSIWCAASQTFLALVFGRIFQGMAVSPVECLPSATIAEIFFLHERAYRLGIYTLLLLGGKNLVPLASAAVVQSLDWRWVFWIVAMVVGMCFFLLFFFVPETFWDRSPQPRVHKHHRPSLAALRRLTSPKPDRAHSGTASTEEKRKREPDDRRARFATDETENSPQEIQMDSVATLPDNDLERQDDASASPTLVEGSPGQGDANTEKTESYPDQALPEQADTNAIANDKDPYTSRYRNKPPKTYAETLKVYSGRLSQDSWLRVAARPFVLFAYPAILWSSAVYSLSVGWLIVLSESVSIIFRNRETYNFSALSVGLVYLSPFIGGVLGSAVAGKGSDIVVRWMARRNGGIYEPEFRLLMAVPIMITTAAGLMGYGWSAQERDNFWVPTIFFGIISFGCSLGSTTAITFAVDSYRQYAGEALVTLNFSKNIFHGLVFSLFFNTWLESDGSRTVFLSIGGIQVFVLLWTVPMYIYGKRARMWTVRQQGRLMGKL